MPETKQPYVLVGTPWGEWADCTDCEARWLDQYRETDPMRWLSRRMIVCPTCGNKRCPKATQHDNACTDSNEYGQEGSAYGGLPTLPLTPELQSFVDSLSEGKGTQPAPGSETAREA